MERYGFLVACALLVAGCYAGEAPRGEAPPTDEARSPESPWTDGTTRLEPNCSTVDWGNLNFNVTDQDVAAVLARGSNGPYALDGRQDQVILALPGEEFTPTKLTIEAEEAGVAAHFATSHGGSSFSYGDCGPVDMDVVPTNGTNLLALQTNSANMTSVTVVWAQWSLLTADGLPHEIAANGSAWMTFEVVQEESIEVRVVMAHDASLGLYSSDGYEGSIWEDYGNHEETAYIERATLEPGPYYIKVSSRVVNRLDELTVRSV